MEITCPGAFQKQLSDWNFSLQSIAYRLNTDKLPPRACDMFIRGQYPRTITVYIQDRYARQSNKISKYIDYKTGKASFL
jgi:hypothetical protein